MPLFVVLSDTISNTSPVVVSDLGIPSMISVLLLESKVILSACAVYKSGTITAAEK